jgi:putative nucleotidyltransferase with HDIG domain
VKAKLIGLKGSVKGQRYELDPNATVILGRGSAATYRLEDTGVSRTHCTIEYEDGFYVVEDLGSRNGTWINGKRISRAKLVHYDFITLGTVQFRFELEPDLSDGATELVLTDEPAPAVAEVREKVEFDSSVEIIAVEPTEESIEKYRELQRDLAAICRIGNLVNAEEDLQRLFNLILDNVMEVTQADRGYVLMPGGGKGDDLLPVTARVKRHSTAGNSQLYSRSLATQCFKSGYALLKTGLALQGADVTDSIVEQEINSVMCVPLQSREGTVGAIYVDNLAGSHAFRKRDLDMLAAIGSQAGIAIRRAQLADRVERLFADCITTLVSVLEAKDDYTKGHSERVTMVALRVGELIGLSPEELKDLRLAGLLHDIGKIGVEKHILDKPGSLTSEEYADIKQHTLVGEKIIASIDNAETIAEAIRYHHETWDGTGYPEGLKAEHIPLLARVLSIADAFDSMVSSRPYRKNFAAQEVVEEFQRCAGNQFDPHICEVFLNAYQGDRSFLVGISEIYDQNGGPAAPGSRMKLKSAKT